MMGAFVPTSRVQTILAVVAAVGLLGSYENFARAQAPADPPAPTPAPPAADASAPAAESVPVVPSQTTEERYDLKLRELEEKVVTLKEKIFRSKTRLMLLKERILNDVIAEAKLVVKHHNDMGSSFKPLEVHYRLDGETLKLLDNATGNLDDDEPLEIFSGNVAPGNHSLSVEMVYQGDSIFFTYLKDYVFKLRASYTFFASKGKITSVTSTGFLKGDITYNITDRPSIKFKVDQKSYTKDSVVNAEGSDE
jgi:hypothetical protein